ncbi:hypothetical protein D8674_040336 [Pyrus ussuriensis x Pyrus communis]|uniref:Uncharacterized protein n=1 Tax=Pyrus ussuriensis x Pyrus communis TaxID=2448454 RepID=A0A5N5H0R7_9ROSA|nr:hypothetical protein D8674_040336 [Pyrus ussuriensis x Pyrus communis]
MLVSNMCICFYITVLPTSSTILILHQVPKGHVGVYWRRCTLLKTITDLGFHLKLSFVTHFEPIQVRDIPCGTKGCVMMNFEKIEDVERALFRAHVEGQLKEMTVMPFRSTCPSSCVFCTVNGSYSRSFFAFSLSSLGYLDFVGFSPSVFLPIFTHFLFDWKLVWAGLIQRFQETVPLKIWDFRFRFSKLSVLKVFLANEIPLPSLSRYFFMIGYCCDDDKKLLVAEYMHHDTLAKHLFNCIYSKCFMYKFFSHVLDRGESDFEWAMRLRVALKIAEVLDYGSIEGRPL